MNYINANFVKVKALNKEGLKKRIIFHNFFFLKKFYQSLET